MSRPTGYLVASDSDLRIDKESDIKKAIERSGACGKLLLAEEDVSSDFFDLRTGLAGAAFQKLTTYGVVVAFVVETPSRYGPRFAELAREHARHPHIRIFTSRASAESWLSV